MQRCRATPGDVMNQENRTRRRAGSRLLGWAERIEDARALDGPAAFLDRLASPLLAPRAVRDALEGQWLGHALHPLATDIPLGCWMSASLLDLVGPSRSEEASRRLIGFGVLAAVPTAAAGVADWVQTEGGARRAGVAHAALNGVVLAAYMASWRARRRAQESSGVALALLGGGLAVVSGYLGGHLSFARGVGVGQVTAAPSQAATSVDHGPPSIGE
jgi:uncharacterized membrane protein